METVSRVVDGRDGDRTVLKYFQRLLFAPGQEFGIHVNPESRGQTNMLFAPSPSASRHSRAQTGTEVEFESAMLLDGLRQRRTRLLNARVKTMLFSSGPLEGSDFQVLPLEIGKHRFNEAQRGIIHALNPCPTSTGVPPSPPVTENFDAIA